MKIILNPLLKKLKKELKKNNINYKDFMINKKLLNLSIEKQVDIISTLSNINVSQEQFNFLINVYKGDEKLFYRISLLIEMGIKIGKNEIELYENYKDIYACLVEIKIHNPEIDSLNQSFIDMWGYEVIKQNYDILYDFNYEEIKDYIDNVKNNPSILRDVFPLLNSTNKIYIKDVLKLSNEIDIKDIVNNLVLIKDEYLKKCYLDNYNNQELKDFLNQIINKYRGEILANKGSFIKELRKETGITKDLAKIICYYDMLELNKYNSGYTQTHALEIIYGTDAPFLSRLYHILIEAMQENFQIPKYLDEFYELYDNVYNKKISNEELINKAYLSINNQNNFNIDQAISWVKNFKAHQLQKGIIDPKKKNIDHYESYTYIDESGNKITKKIPIIKIDDPNFRAIVHKVEKKNDKTSPNNYKLTEKLIDNPSLWETSKEGNPNISMSYLYKQMNIFGSDSGVLLGFSKISPERLLSSINIDGATPMDRLASNKLIEFCSQKELEHILKVYGSGSWGYNEILTARYCNDDTIKPDYIMVVSGCAKYNFNLDLAHKWASYFNIPIIEIDGKKLKEYHFKEYNNILNTIKGKGYIKDYSIIEKLFEERVLMDDYQDKGEIYTIPTLLDTFLKLVKNINLNNKENATYILKLINNLDGKWDFGYVGLHSTNIEARDPRMNIEKFKKIELYINDIKIKCQQVINEEQESIGKT